MTHGNQSQASDRNLTDAAWKRPTAQARVKLGVRGGWVGTGYWRRLNYPKLNLGSPSWAASPDSVNES